MSSNFETDKASLERIPLNILSNGPGYILIWVTIILAGSSCFYLPSSISGIVFFGLILALLSYEYWRPERYLHEAARTGDIEAIKKYLKKRWKYQY